MWKCRNGTVLWRRMRGLFRASIMLGSWCRLLEYLAHPIHKGNPSVTPANQMTFPALGTGRPLFILYRFMSVISGAKKSFIADLRRQLCSQHWAKYVIQIERMAAGTEALEPHRGQVSTYAFHSSAPTGFAPINAAIVITHTAQFHQRRKLGDNKFRNVGIAGWTGDLIVGERNLAPFWSC